MMSWRKLFPQRRITTETLLSLGLFDVAHYSKYAACDFQTEKDGCEHYLEHSLHQNVSPHPLFDGEWYSAFHTDVAKKWPNPFIHYVVYGIRENRQPHPLFDPNFYANKASGLGFVGCDLIAHYCAIGWRSNIPPHPLFDPRFYLMNNEDVAAANADPFRHFIMHGAAEGRSPSADFDMEWYLQTYPDVRQAGINGLTHFLSHGASEGRNPSDYFDTAWYLDANKDVARSGMNPLVHYVQYGRHEGRKPFPSEPFQLNKNYFIESRRFARWRSRLFSSRPANEQSHAKIHIASLVVVISCAGMEGEQYKSTRNSVESACNSLKKSAKFLRLNEANDYNDPDCVILFLFEGDRIDAKGLNVLINFVSEGGSFWTFDSFFEKEKMVYPILLPGANIVYLREAGAEFAKFAIKGSFLSQIQRDSVCTTQKEILLNACAIAEREWDAETYRHCASPVVQTHLSVPMSPELQVDFLSNIDRFKDRNRLLHESVTIVICTKNNGMLIDQLLRNIFDTSDPLVKSVVLVANDSTNAYALRSQEKWSNHAKVKIITYNKSFNFSEQSNMGARYAETPFILFLNDDTTPITSNWLDLMLAPMGNERVGAVGPLLVYPDERVQHAGMFLGFRGAAGHAMRFARLPDEDYLFYASAPRQVSCLTGAALLVRKSLFDDMNGFDAQLCSIFQDIDLCLRLENIGFWLVYEPRSILLHMESVTINQTINDPVVAEQRGREHQYLLRRHGDERFSRDKFCNSNFSLGDESFRTLAIDGGS